MSIAGRSSSDLIGQAQSNYGKGWDQGQMNKNNLTGTNSIAAKRRARNLKRRQEAWVEQKHAEDRWKGSLEAFRGGVNNARNTVGAGYDAAQGRIDQFGNYLTDQRAQGMDRLSEGFQAARDQYAPLVERGDDAYNWLLGSSGGGAHFDYMQGALGDSWYDDRAAKQAAATSNARGSLGTLAQAGIEEARRGSALGREQMAYNRLMDDRSMYGSFYDQGVGARQNISGLHTGEATSMNNYGQAYDAFLGQNNALAAQNILGKAGYMGDLDLAVGNAEMGLWNRRDAQAYDDYKWGRDSGYQIDNWAADAELQDYFMDKQLASMKDNSKNQLMSGLLGGATKLALAPMTGGGSLFGSMFS